MTRTFGFAFDVNNEFLRLSPVATEYVRACKNQVAARMSAIGPRGGLYRLVTPPDGWRESSDDYYRNVTAFATTRQGRYVRPDRITPDLRLGESIHFDTLTVAVVDGTVILPSGKIASGITVRFVTFPVMTT